MQNEVSRTQSKIDRNNGKAQILSGTIGEYSAKINSIQGSVTGLAELTRRLDLLERTGSIPLQRFLDEQTLKRRETASQKWGMIVAIVSGIFALLAATITGVIQIMSASPPAAVQALPAQEWRQYPPPPKAVPSSPAPTGK
jgi:hypothetical protein